MGREQAEIRIVGSLSRHNSDRDAADNGLWADLARRVKMLAAEPRYASILVDVSSSHDEGEI